MTTSVLGTGLALVVLGSTIAAIYVVSRRPFIGLGVIVAGMAVHNFVLMLLLNLQTPGPLVRVVQGWKELVLAALVALAVVRLLRARTRGERWRWIPTDWMAIAFTGILLVYLALPSSVLGGDTNLLQKLIAFRVDALIPLLYFLPRLRAAGGTRPQRDRVADSRRRSFRWRIRRVRAVFRADRTLA